MSPKVTRHEFEKLKGDVNYLRFVVSFLLIWVIIFPMLTGCAGMHETAAYDRERAYREQAAQWVVKSCGKNEMDPKKKAAWCEAAKRQLQFWQDQTPFEPGKRVYAE